MSEVKLTETTKQVIRDLQDDLDNLLSLGSNIEVVWKLEKLHQHEAFLKSADFIRKSLK